jgi:PAS domain S-box-containing protein
MEMNIFELLLETGKSLSSEIELEKLVQRITDIGTELSGAEFGAFFYNVVNQAGESYYLYTISGVPKEVFSKFPMPRNTPVFHPTFAGIKTVRYDDVTAVPHYGTMEPFHGMPRGHLPVRSYLATPVISPVTKEVIGGLFFGHSATGVFTERSERLIEGIAAQAAIAMGNARLFEEKKRIEKSLLEQREQYRSIFHSTTDAMIIYDEEGKVIELNHAATDLLGYTYREMTQMNGRELMLHAAEFESIQSIVRSGRRYYGQGMFCTKKDGAVAVQIVGTHYLHKGKTHLLTVLKTISSDKKITEALEKSETFAQTLANVSPVTLWMTNERGEATYINHTWTELVGGRAEDHLGYGWREAILPEDRHAVVEAFLSAFRKRTVFSYDFRIRRRDGSIRWCSSYGSPYYLPNGVFGGFAGSLTDITERKLTEEKLASQHVLINTITNNTLHALFMIDERHYCTYMNPAAEKMTGYRLEELQDKPLHYYIHHTRPDGRHFPLEECPIDSALPAQVQTRGEEVFIRKNGSFFPVAFVASPIVEQGIPKGTVIEVRDLTEEKKLQEALHNKEKQTMALLEQKVQERTAELEKKNYELMQFSSVASHDLKEPARKVAIFSEYLKEQAKDFENVGFHRYMDNIISSSRRMVKLVDDLLAFSRLSDTQHELQEVDLNDLLHHIIDDLQLAIAEKKAHISYAGLPVVKGISFQLGQVFQNLISNSLKFSYPDRPPVVTITSVKDNNRYCIRYADNGIGFPENMSQRIFNVFERLHGREKYEGTGIGLAIVKKIIDQHGGQITAEGREGEGAVFYIVLPV